MKVKLTITNWQYKGLTVYRDDNGVFYIAFEGGIYPIDFSDLPRTIKHNRSKPVTDYEIHGKMSRDQE